MCRFFVFSILGMCLLLTACGSDYTNPSYISNNFFCDSARQMVFAIGQDGQSATVTYQGRNISMSRVVSENSGMTFTNSIHTLHYERGVATLIEETTPVLTSCVRES